MTTGEIIPQNKAIVAIKRSLAPRIDDIGRKLGENVDVRRYLNVCLSQFEHNPRLCECTPVSIYHSLIQAADLGIVPNGTVGQGYLIPYKMRGVMTCTFQIGYQGLVELVWRSGMVDAINAQVVYKDDEFHFNAASPWDIRHNVNDDGDHSKTNIRGFYALALVKGSGKPMVVYMSNKQIQEHRDRFSRAADKPDSPWTSDYEAMAKKTVLKQLIKLLPKSTDIRVQKAIAMDSLAERGLSQDMALTGNDDWIDTTAEPVEQEPSMDEPPPDSYDDAPPYEDAPEPPKNAPGATKARPADTTDWEIQQYRKLAGVGDDELVEMAMALNSKAKSLSDLNPDCRAQLVRQLKAKAEKKG